MSKPESAEPTAMECSTCKGRGVVGPRALAEEPCCNCGGSGLAPTPTPEPALPESPKYTATEDDIKCAANASPQTGHLLATFFYDADRQLRAALSQIAALNERVEELESLSPRIEEMVSNAMRGNIDSGQYNGLTVREWIERAEAAESAPRTFTYLHHNHPVVIDLEQAQREYARHLVRIEELESKEATQCVPK